MSPFNELRALIAEWLLGVALSVAPDEIKTAMAKAVYGYFKPDREGAFMTQPITPEKLRELSQIASEFGHTVYADALNAAADEIESLREHIGVADLALAVERTKAP